MKLLILVALCFISSSIFAQYKNPNAFRFRRIEGDTLTLKMFTQLATQVPAGIYQLPLDRMPCIVPDMHASVEMPNAWQGPVVKPFTGNIPNAAMPKRKEKVLRVN
ncbi:MAG: hypothetical protein ACJ749_13005 [Flavisolibacter sp.]